MCRVSQGHFWETLVNGCSSASQPGTLDPFPHQPGVCAMLSLNSWDLADPILGTRCVQFRGQFTLGIWYSQVLALTF